LKPFAANAREKIAFAIAGLQKSDDGIKVDARINDLRLSDIAFDAKTLRVIAQAEGTIKVTVTRLPDL